MVEAPAAAPAVPASPGWLSRSPAGVRAGSSPHRSRDEESRPARAPRHRLGRAFIASLAHGIGLPAVSCRPGYRSSIGSLRFWKLQSTAQSVTKASSCASVPVLRFWMPRNLPIRGDSARRAARRDRRTKPAPARMKSEIGPPMTLGSAALAGVRLIVWCSDCARQVDVVPAAMAERGGADRSVSDWRRRLACSGCGSRNIEMVVSGTRRRVDPPALGTEQ